MTTRGSGSGSGLGLGARAGPLCAFILLEKYVITEFLYSYLGRRSNYVTSCCYEMLQTTHCGLQMLRMFLACYLLKA